MNCSALFLLCTSASFPSQTTDKIVKLDISAMRWEQAAPIYCKAMGWGSNVFVPDNLKDEVVIIRSTDATQNELKSKVEEVLGVTFEKRSEGLFLTQSQKQKQEEQKEFELSENRRLGRLLDAVQAKANTMKPFDEARAKELQKEIERMGNDPQIYKRFNQVRKLDLDSPLCRFLMNVIKRFSPEMLKSLKDERPRIVFSSQPTQMQLPLPFKTDDLISNLKEEQEVWSRIGGLKPVQPVKQTASNAGQLAIADPWLGSLNYRRVPFSQDDFETFTLAWTLEEYGGVTVMATFYNSKGEISGGERLNAYDFTEASAVDAETQAQMYEKDRESKKPKLIGIAKEFQERLTATQLKSLPISPELKSAIIQPESIDPLSISAAEIFKVTAQDRNIVAKLDDAQIFTSFLTFDLQKYSDTQDEVILPQLSDRWLLQRLPNAKKKRTSRLERDKLGRLLRFVNKNPRSLTIEEKSDFKATLPWRQKNQYLYDSLANMISPDSRTDFGNGNAGYRIFGKMSESNRNLISRPDGASISSISTEAQAEIFRCLFYDNQWSTMLQFDNEAINKLPQEERNKVYALQSQMAGGKLAEKTFLLPNGLTREMNLKSTETKKTMIFAARPAGNNAGAEKRMMTPKEVGQFTFWKTNPKRYAWILNEQNDFDPRKLRLGVQRTLNLKLRLVQFVNVQWNLEEASNTDTKNYTVDSLPEAIKLEINEGYKSAEEADRKNGVLYDQFRGQGSPPPPPTT